MNVTISIDCTPAEAREFFGLPDVSEMQSELMTEMQRSMAGRIENMDSADLLAQWMPSTTKGFEPFQQLFRQMGMPKTEKE